MSSNQSRSSSALWAKPVLTSLRDAGFDLGGRDRRQKQVLAALIKPSRRYCRNGRLAGCERTQNVGVEQPTGHKSASRSGERSRSVSTAWGMRINSAAKLGRSAGYIRRASSTGTTTAAGLPYLVIVVASPRSAASTTAEREDLASRKRSVFTSCSCRPNCDYM